MLSIIGLDACVNVVYYKAKVIVLEHSHTNRDKCVYTCVISGEHEKRLGSCVLYRRDEPPRTSPQMIMKIFSERLRKVYVVAHGWDGTLDMTDVFSRTTAVEKGKEKVVVVREKCADCDKLFERKELQSDNDELYCDPCWLRLGFYVNDDAEDVINDSGPHHPQNDVVDADTARKIHRKQTTSQNDKVIAQFAAEDFEARKELKKSKERVGTFKLAAKKAVYRGLRDFFEDEEEEEKEEKPGEITPDHKKYQGKNL